MTREDFQRIPKWALVLAGFLIPMALGGMSWIASVDARVVTTEVEVRILKEQLSKMDAKLDRIMEWTHKP